MMNIRSFIGVACAAVAIATVMPAAGQDGETVTPYFNQAIPNIPGKSLVAQFVDYAPGGASASHAHAKSAFVFAYVLSGEIESQVNDRPACEPLRLEWRRLGNWGPAVSPVPGGEICSWGVAAWPPVGWDYAGVWLTDRYRLSPQHGVRQNYASNCEA